REAALHFAMAIRYRFSARERSSGFDIDMHLLPFYQGGIDRYCHGGWIVHRWSRRTKLRRNVGHEFQNRYNEVIDRPVSLLKCLEIFVCKQGLIADFKA